MTSGEQTAPESTDGIAYARARDMAGVRWQGALAQCSPAAVDVVLQRVEGRHALGEIEDHHPGAGVATARLADRARVERVLARVDVGDDPEKGR